MKNLWIRRGLLVFGAIVSILLILFFAGIVLIFKSLPSPGQISQILKTENGSVSEGIQGAGRSFEDTQDRVDSPDVESQKNVDQTLESIKSQQTKDSASDSIRKFLDEDIRDMRVCRNLGNSKILDDQKNSPPRGDSGNLDFSEAFADESREDSFAESMRYPVKAILQDSSVKPLLEEIFEIQHQIPQDQANKESFLNKIGFYSRVTAAAANLYRKKDHFEYLGNRSVHLGVLARIAHLKPEMRTDPRLNELCQEISQSMIDEKPIDLKTERQQLIELISEAGLTPEQLDFDPTSFIKLNINASDKGFMVNLTDKEKVP